MKKAFVLILALTLCLSLCACGGESQNSQNDNDIPNTEDNNTATAGNGANEPAVEALVLYDETGFPFLNQARLHEIVEEVELTTENWSEHIEVCSYTVETVEKDAFGEITATNTSTAYVLGAKNNRYYHLREFVIELKDKSTGELKIHNSTNVGGQVSVDADFSLEQYECTRIKGTLYLIDLPKEVIRMVENREQFFTVRYADISYGPPMICLISGKDGYEIGQMLDMVLY